jgi:accessory gene regulator protein AgrB
LLIKIKNRINNNKNVDLRTIDVLYLSYTKQNNIKRRDELLTKIAIGAATWIHTNTLNKDMVDYNSLESKIKVLTIYLLLFPILIIIGLQFNIMVQILISTISFIFLRIWNGGHHFESVDICLIFTLTFILFPPFINPYIDSKYIHIMNYIGIVLIAFYSPFDKSSKSSDLKKKIILLILSILSPYISNILCIAIFLQSLDLIKFRSARGE